MGSGQDLGGSKGALAEDDGGGVSVGMTAGSVGIEAVSIGGSGVESVGVESVGVESVGVEALGAAVEEVMFEAVALKSLSVDDVVGIALSIEAIFLIIIDFHVGPPSLHL